VTLTVTNSLGEDVAVQTCAVLVEAPVTDCIELFISEYVEGSANNKAIELHNPTDEVISLTGYRLLLFTNGGTIANSFLDLTGTLPPLGTLVIVNPQANATFLALADITSAVCGFNGDDAVELRKNNVPIDAVGVVGVDPGASWPVGSGSTANRTLVRKVQVTGPNADWATGALEWDVYGEDDTSHLGDHTGACGLNTGMQQVLEQGSLDLFPVPASTMLMVGTDASSPVPTRIQVLSAQGALVKEVVMRANPHALEVSDLEPGHYLVRVNTTDGQRRMARFSVVR
jgi:hypothetical protein